MYRPRVNLLRYATALAAAVAATTNCAAVACAKHARLDDDRQSRYMDVQAVMSQKYNLRQGHTKDRGLGSLAGLVLLACNRLTTDCVKLLELSLYAEMSRKRLTLTQ